ncbi:TetR/AcrR family transcriptional regulator [Nocardioides alcanivorans]|uniref:TetR/AcrR family transcriptional regulator n=1 Tax=Nocardioides alcanivorans TaxID=2897352 RepID=UPI001F17DDAE|nr:TetR/AcrR family transcriptional regulator [Nocardioides alcanivorans]
MSETNRKSIHGDAEARRRGTLDAAAALLDEGGYGALTIRAVAQRAGTSTGLIYKYFADKHDIFVALLNESQIESAHFVAQLPRTDGVAALIEAVIPEAARQWSRVGRMTAVWREAVGNQQFQRASLSEVLVTAEQYNRELERAVVEAARIEGRKLVDGPAMIPFVLSGLMGVSDTLVNNWARHIDPAELITFTAEVITRGITA